VKLKCYFIFFIAVIFFSCKEREENVFIKVKGTKFILKNKPYYFAGANIYYAAYLGASKEGRERLLKELDLLNSYGITNIRIMGASEYSSFKKAIHECFILGPNEYNEQLLQGLDFALSEIGKRKMHAIIYLTNYWQWSGGMTQYLKWANDFQATDPDVNNEWRDYMTQSATFYRSDTAQKIFRDYVYMLINRKNTFSNILYKDDPAIMAWELANEPRPGPDKDNDSINIEILTKWVDQTAQFIHSIDPNHLVCSGSEGIVGCVQSIDGFLKIHCSKYIDYLNFHLWPKNWGWFNSIQPEKTFSSTIYKTTNYILIHIELARKLGKPITLEEFGMERDSGKYNIESTVFYRNKFFQHITNLLLDSINNNSPIAGFNFWAWGGYGFPANVDEVNIKNPMSFVGDPLSEPQGLNSIFASDTSTLKIFRNFYHNIKNISDTKAY